MIDTPLCPVRITDRQGNVIGFVHDSDLRKAIKEAVMVNRYRADLNHDDGRGIDFELYADDEAAAREAALASAPAGAFAERVVPMEIDVTPPVPPDPPITRSEGEDDAAYAARVAAAQEAARAAAAERQAAIDRGEKPAVGDLPPLPVPEWPALTEAEAAAWEAKAAAAEAKKAAEARLAADVPALEHAPVEAHEPTRAEARAAAKAEAKAERDDARRR